MSEKTDIIADAFSKYLTGFALSKAILEDYIKVVAKLENVPEQEVKDRVWKRTDEIYQEVLAKQKEQIGKASQEV
jgi:hypothetical protein